MDLLKRLNGQFAFAIYDRQSEVVFIARDRFGVRPFYYAQPNGSFYFGSEIKAILASGEVEATMDRRGLEQWTGEMVSVCRQCAAYALAE